MQGSYLSSLGRRTLPVCHRLQPRFVARSLLNKSPKTLTPTIYQLCSLYSTQSELPVGRRASNNVFLQPGRSTSSNGRSRDTPQIPTSTKKQQASRQIAFGAKAPHVAKSTSNSRKTTGNSSTRQHDHSKNRAQNYDARNKQQPQDLHLYRTAADYLSEFGIPRDEHYSRLRNFPLDLLLETGRFTKVSIFGSSSRTPRGDVVHHVRATGKMQINDTANSFVGYGAAGTQSAAQKVAWLHIACQIHQQMGPEQFMGTTYDKSELTYAVLKMEKDSKLEVYEYCAAYNGVPEFHYRRVPRNRQHEIIVNFPPQDIKIVVRHRDVVLGDTIACFLFKKKAEQWHAQNADSNLQVKNILSLNSSNARQFLDICKQQRKISQYDCTSPDEKSSRVLGMHSLQTLIDGKPSGQVVHGASRKVAETLAYFVAALKLREAQPEIFADFIEALRVGKGEVLKPLSPIWFRSRWDYLQPMVDTVNMVRRIGIPREYSDTKASPERDAVSKGRSFGWSPPSPHAVKLRSQELLDEYLAYNADPSIEEMRTKRADLPMNQHAAQVLGIVKNNPVSIIVGATGSGKTTQVPQILLEDAVKTGEGALCNIICTQPRRIAATSVAQRVAQERNEPLRKTIGYHVRFDSKVAAPNGSINFCTTGILLQQLRSNAEAALRGISHILIDEVHERDIQIDFLMVLLKRVMRQREQQGLPPIKVVLMSATMNTELFAGYFASRKEDGRPQDCPSLSVPGRTFPVTEYFLDDVRSMLRTHYSATDLKLLQDPDTKEYLELESRYKAKVSPLQLTQASGNGNVLEDDTFIDWKRKSIVRDDGEVVVSNEKEDGLTPCGLIATMVAHLARTTDAGDILVFLPGLAEIKLVDEMLRQNAPLGVDFQNSNVYSIDILHSSLPQQQMDVFHANAAGKRKIILSTNIAETSVTIPEVRYVIDSGKLREKRFEQTSRITKLQCTWISKSNSKQRAGRAGRVRNGHYYALFTRERFTEFKPSGLPEILRSDLQEICLDIRAQGFKDPIAQFLSEAIEPPSSTSIEAALSQLRGLGALEKDETLTNLGKVLATMPVEPALGKMILLGVIFKCLDPMIILGAASGGRDLFISPLERKKEAQAIKAAFAKGTGSDHMATINAFREWRTRRDNESTFSTLRFTDDNFLHRGALRVIDQTANQIEEVLVTEGIIPYLPKTKRFKGEYGHPRLNENSASIPLIKALSLAGTYPNVAVALGGLGFRTMEENFVMIHPGSTNYSGRNSGLPRDTIVSFGTKARSGDGKSTYMRDVTQSTVLNTILFGGKPTQQTNMLLFDGWIPVSINDERVLKVVLQFRLVLDKVLNYVFQNVSTRKSNSEAAEADEKLRDIVAGGVLEVLEKYADAHPLSSIPPTRDTGRNMSYRSPRPVAATGQRSFLRSR
ncbi:ATP-dependent RNA helicase A [Arthrobotrys musiformis]|uniref:RNA helicase n=1 Tax=Arthrobotrys musiformis TaxID=47236 RepID=A0AAV9VUZ3_9PEZI